MINPARIRILAVGKVRKGWVQEGIALYRRRLPGLEIAELKDSTMVKEAEAISEQLRSKARAALKSINRFPVCEIEDLVASGKGQLDPAIERPQP